MGVLSRALLDITFGPDLYLKNISLDSVQSCKFVPCPVRSGNSYAQSGLALVLRQKLDYEKARIN